MNVKKRIRRQVRTPTNQFLTMEYSTLYTVSADMQVAVLVAVATGRQPVGQANECLDELDFLARTQGITSVARFTQRLAQPDCRTYLGKGKLEVLAGAGYGRDTSRFADFECRAQSQQSRLALEPARQSLTR